MSVNELEKLQYGWQYHFYLLITVWVNPCFNFTRIFFGSHDCLPYQIQIHLLHCVWIYLDLFWASS